MIKDILLNVVRFVLLVCLQVFLLDNVHFLGFINPMVYIWFIIMLPFATPKWLVMVCGFAIGMCVDVFSADIGINALACVLIGFLRPMLLSAFSGNIDNASFGLPSINSLGVKNFVFYALSMILIHHLVYFSVEVFDINEIGQILARTILSSIVTLIIILLLDMIFFPRKS